eukprot:TRINITY_DN1012_c0_g1_i2.p1 TRINITY_DN1012_c0_g1~~TRINITY_DN1012_c0_g1_i2.p1  ORF type:complete len:612 (+),score=127.75 TRINITY_DN1012_c0_g1_i2:406-2241(+)
MNEKILERQAGLRIVFNYFQKSPGYKGINGKWEKFYGDMKDVRLGIEDALKIVVEDALKHKSIDEKNTIVVIGVDEFKKFTNNHEQLRSLICKASDQFYKKYIDENGKKKDNLQVRMIFTSFLPTDAPESNPTERPIRWVTLESLSKKVVTEELMKEYYDFRPAFRAVINCCIGHQRALEQVYSILTNSKNDNMNNHWFFVEASKTAPIYARGANGDYERNVFFDLMKVLSQSMIVYTQKASWELFEPCLTGREISPIYRETNPNTKEESILFTYTSIFNYQEKQQEETKIPFVNMFSNGIYSPALSNDSYNKKIVPQSNLFWLYCWQFYNKGMLDFNDARKQMDKKDDTPQNNVFVIEAGHSDVRLKFLTYLLLPFSFDPKTFEKYSSFQLALKLECTRVRTNQISLLNLYNGALRWNPKETIDPNQIFIQFSSKPISYSECDYQQFSTFIKDDPRVFSEGNLVSVNGNNKGFDHFVPLLCKFGKNGKEERTILSTQIRYEHHDVQNRSYSKLSEVQSAIENSKKEYEKAGLAEVKKIHIFNSFHQTERKEKSPQQKENPKKPSISFIEDKDLPKDSYIVTDNVTVFGPTFSLNNIAHFLDYSYTQGSEK